MRLKSRDIWYTLALLVAVGVGAAIAIWYFDLGPPSEISEKAIGEARVISEKVITPQDVDREGKRSWVLMYKMAEYQCKKGLPLPPDDPIEIAMEKRNKLFDEYFEAGADQTHSLEERYWIAVKTNQVMEEALAQVMDEEEFRALKGKYTLEEAYGSLERANATVEKCREGQED